MSWVTLLAVGGMTNGPLPLHQKTATARLHDHFLTRRHPPVKPAPPPPPLLLPPSPLAATASLGLLFG